MLIRKKNLEITGRDGAVIPAIFTGGSGRRAVLIAPVTDYRRNILTPDTNWGKETFVQTPDGSGGVCYRLSDAYFLGNALIRELRELDIPAIFERISEQNRRDPEGRKQRILIFHGERDPKIAFDGSRELALKYPETVGLTALPDTVHGLTQTGDEDFSAPRTMKNLETVIAAVSGADAATGKLFERNKGRK